MGGVHDDIRDAVDDQLTFDPDVDAAESHITVETMNGEVTPNGTVPSYPQYLAAAAAARRVADVPRLRAARSGDRQLCKRDRAR